jgi:glyoxylase-like metal-dependent hydrolase (beta-lactamase superfamily II)
LQSEDHDTPNWFSSKRSEAIMSEDFSFSRRRLLAGAGALLTAQAAGTTRPARAAAKAVLSQAPAFYRFKIGEIVGTVISDGLLELGEPSQSISGPKEEIAELLAANFHSNRNWMVDQNVLALNVAGRVVLFDTGMGTSSLFGTKAGRMIANLKAAGIDPRDVDDVVVSHAHPDHCWALMADDGTHNFPNARIHIAQSDFEFWTDESKAALNDMMKSIIERGRRQLLPNRERLSFLKDGQEIVSGVQALAAPGHTVGHTIFMIASAGQTLCYLADVTHHYVLSLEKPRFEFVYDTDPKQAVATRLRVLDMLAANRTMLLGYHFPWPGMGHVAKHGEGYRFFPTPMSVVEP